MGLFISYSSQDRTSLDALTAALRRGQQQVWFDQELGGGDSWWNKILEQIRSCDVFIIALSNHWLQSKPSQSELRYAQALKRPILPVRIGAVDSVRVNPVSALQIIDYQNPTADTGIQLVTAVHALRDKPEPLPEPLPDEPPVPFGYIMRLGNTLAEKELSPQLQLQLLVELRSGLDEDGDDPSARGDIAQLLRMLRLRHDVTYRTRSEIDNVLASIATDEPTQPPPNVHPATPEDKPESVHPATPEDEPESVHAATPEDEPESFPGPQWSHPAGQEQPNPVPPPPQGSPSYSGQPYPPPPQGSPSYSGQPYPPPPQGSPSYSGQPRLYPAAGRGAAPEAPYRGDPATETPLSDKKAVIAGMLQLLVFFGIFGLGRFYIGSKIIGGCQLGLTILNLVFFLVLAAAHSDATDPAGPAATVSMLVYFGVIIWAFVDAIRMFTRSVTDGQGRKLR